MKVGSAGFVAASLLALVSAGACTPMRESHGWVADSTSTSSEVQAGVDTKSTVLARMGSPSTQGVFGQQTWYYITTLQQSFAFYNPKTTARAILAVRFNDDDVVASVDKFGVERGRVINYADQKTPTRGRELGVIEQLFGNIGSSSPVRPPEEDESRRDRR
ncbi:MAG: outer membrane protein assembly factor BamE [Hyphomonadaceae bacterium]